MNEQEVDRQINQMVQFIKQDLEEKANEIRVYAEEVGLSCPVSLAACLARGIAI